MSLDPAAVLCTLTTFSRVVMVMFLTKNISLGDPNIDCHNKFETFGVVASCLAGAWKVTTMCNEKHPKLHGLQFAIICIVLRKNS